MPDKTIDTQEGPVVLGQPTEAPPETNVAYSSPSMAQEAAQKLADQAAEIFRGEDWSDLPNFYCPACGFATLDGDVAVFNHGLFRHPGVDLKEQVRNG